jgi:hypothetical protein
VSERDWINQMWYSGYCHEAVTFASATDLASGGQQRVAWLQKHVPECRECQHANLLKGIEASISEGLGFLEEFNQGGDVATQPGYQESLKRHLDAGMKMGMIDGEFFEWIDRAAKRRGKPWPGSSS